MNIKSEKVILLIVLIASLVVALGSGVGVYLLQKKAGRLQAENTALHSRIAKARTKLNNLNALRAERETAEARLKVAERILPSRKEIEDLVDNLSEFARKSGVVITKAKPVNRSAYAGARGAVKRFEEASFDLALKGDFFEFVEFLNCLENYKRFIRTDSFTLKAGRNEGTPLDIALKFATFTYNEAPATPAKAPVRAAAKGGR
ncbi:MAG: type 4a pilus biogenesis protein PilO [Planctomycetes bacterium]|nr:type 4a pilus biogenesis protein PilO [Planctomycetota bacterium]